MRQTVAVLLILFGSISICVPDGMGVYGDIVFERKVEAPGTPVAFFPHWLHRIRFRCAVCHPAIFESKRGANPISMEEMRGGKFCAVCHNGKLAWGIRFDTCPRCHTAQGVGE